MEEKYCPYAFDLIQSIQHRYEYNDDRLVTIDALVLTEKQKYMPCLGSKCSVYINGVCKRR